MIPLKKIELPFLVHAKGKGNVYTFVTEKGDNSGELADRIERDDDTVYITRHGVTIEVPWQQCKFAVRGPESVHRDAYRPLPESEPTSGTVTAGTTGTPTVRRGRPPKTTP